MIETGELLEQFGIHIVSLTNHIVNQSIEFHQMLVYLDDDRDRI